VCRASTSTSTTSSRRPSSWRPRSRDGGHEIENRGANGTKVNGHWLESVQSLAPGDAIFISRYILIYQSDDVPPVEDAKTVLVDHMSPESTPS
jgi:hypothetical protein